MRHLLPQITTALVMLFVSHIANAIGYDFVQDGIYYTIQEDGTVWVYNGGQLYAGNVNIPSSIKYKNTNYIVSGIDHRAFDNCTKLTSVTIPNTVTYIGKYAFSYCQQITSIDIPNSVTRIDNFAFQNCNNLFSITIGEQITGIGESAFHGCDALTELNFNAVNCSNLSSFNTSIFPSSVTNLSFGKYVVNIPKFFLSNGSNIRTLIFPPTLLSIGEQAFCNNTKLGSVTIPNSVISIGTGAFDGCSTLSSLNFNAISCFTQGSTDLPLFPPAVQNLSFGNSVTKIPDYFLAGGSNITNISLPASLLEIGDCAFHNNDRLTSVTIPDLVTSIGKDAFTGCSALNSLNYNATNCSADGSANAPVFPPAVRNLSLGNSVTKIPDYFLAGGSNITNISLPAPILEIGDCAFHNNDRLTSVTIPDLVTSIGKDAFTGCSALNSLNYNATNCSANGSANAPVFPPAVRNLSFGNSVTKIPDYFLAGGSNITNISLPTSLLSIGKQAFYNNTKLTSIVIPSSVTSIDDYAFAQCIGMLKAAYPENLKSPFHNGSAIGYPTDAVIDKYGVIYDKTKTKVYFAPIDLKSEYTIPNTTVDIMEGSFSHCYNLSSVTIPNVTKSIGNMSFYKCNALTSVIFNAEKCTASATKTSPVFPASVKTLTVGDNVTIIPDYFLAGGSNITNVSLPASLLEIGDCAFFNNSRLTSVTIPSSVTAIGKNAFYGCSALNSLNFNATSCSANGSANAPVFPPAVQNLSFGNSVTQIPDYFLAGGSNIINITLPSSLLEIGNCAFYNNDRLTSVTIPGSVTAIGKDAFTGCSALNNLNYNATNCSANGSANAPVFPPAIQNLSFGNSVTKIPDYFLAGGSNITNISLPASLLTIGKQAFYNNTKLTSIVIPRSVISIDDDAFAKCDGLLKTAYPENLNNPFSNGSAIGYPQDAVIDKYGVIYDNTKTKVYFAPIALNNEYTIPNTIVDIMESSFSHCYNLHSITIPNATKSIGNMSFYECDALTDVTFNAQKCTTTATRFTPVFPASVKNLTIGDNVTIIPRDFLSRGSNITNISLPASLLEIGDCAFYNNAKLSSVTIPSSVTAIGENAFYGCSALNSLNFNATNCSAKGSTRAPVFPPAVQNLSFGNSVAKIPDYFLAGGNIENLFIPNNITTIPAHAFSSCSKLKSVVISAGVSSIDPTAFYNTNNIVKAIWLGNTPPTNAEALSATINYVSNNQYSLKNMKTYEFLSSYFIVDGAIYIPLNPADRICTVIDCIYSSDIKSAIIHSKVVNKGIEMRVIDINDYSYYNNTHIEKIAVNNQGIVGSHAFAHCSSALSVTATNKGNIGSSAFKACNSLKSATVSNKGNVGEGAFMECINLKTINVSNNGDLGQFTFKGCETLESATISNNGNVGQYAFNECTSLISATISNNGDIQENAFWKCKSLKTVNIYSNGDIGNNVFKECSSLENANIYNKGEIKNAVFSGLTKLSTVNIGDDVTGIGESAFAGCTAIETMYIPSSVRNIGKSAFFGCEAMNSIYLSNGFTKLPENVFSGCSSLESIFIPNSVMYIGDNAFQGCTSLKDVTMDECSEEINENTSDVQTFPDWTSTNHEDNSVSSHEYVFTVYPNAMLSFDWTVDCEAKYDMLIVKINGNTELSESGNKTGNFQKQFTTTQEVIMHVLYTKDGTNSKGTDKVSLSNIRLYGCGTSTSLHIDPNGTTPLFKDCPLNEVYIGRRLVYTTSPFYQNTSLQTVEISDHETTISDKEFYGCSKLKSFKTGNGITNIGKWAFSGCSSLENFTAGSKVKNIGEEAFSDCTGLTKYYSYSETPPACGSQALDDINKWECTLYVPTNSRDEYEAATQWKEFFFIEETSSILVAQIDLNAYNLTLELDETFQLSATVLPANASNKEVSFTSSNPEVASVGKDGLITALNEGNAEIRVRSADGNSRATCLVHVDNRGGIDSPYTKSEYKLVKTANGYIVQNAYNVPVEVLSMAGQVLQSYQNYSENELCLSPGIYIIRADNKVWKVKL